MFDGRTFFMKSVRRVPCSLAAKAEREAPTSMFNCLLDFAALSSGSNLFVNYGPEVFACARPPTNSLNPIRDKGARTQITNSEPLTN